MEPPGRDKVRDLQSLLARTLRISIQDGRSFVGTFACVDREKNIVLSSTEEYPRPAPDSTDGPRFIGLIMVPWRWVVQVELEVNSDDLQASYLDDEYT
ncbi:LSM domain-containing protein [Ceratobasidium sp. AG-Ba]|nr:LSM domain-containing protein [Ceratobasidium sp. AG-Ba]